MNRSAADPWHRRLLGWLIGVAIRVWSWTVRCRTEGFAAVDALRRRGERLVYVFWHGRQFLMLGANEGERAVIMVSLSRDGALQKAVVEHFGYHTVRGSNSRRGRRALLEMRRLLTDGGLHGGFAVDGPRGPRHEAKPGAVLLAQTTGAWIVPMGAAARHHWELGTWDRMQIPRPFSSGWVVYGRPFLVEDGGEDEPREEGLRALQAGLDEVTRRADALCRGEATAGDGVAGDAADAAGDPTEERCR